MEDKADQKQAEAEKPAEPGKPDEQEKPAEPTAAERRRRRGRDHPQRGVALFLLLGMVAAMGACVFVLLFADQGAELAGGFGSELPPLARMYVSTSAAAFALPAFTWLVAMAITGAGRRQRNLGVMLGMFLFGFAVLWSTGAVLAFMDAYNPPLGTPPSANTPG